jgi:hypothetical protein
MVASVGVVPVVLGMAASVGVVPVVLGLAASVGVVPVVLGRSVVLVMPGRGMVLVMPGRGMVLARPRRPVLVGRARQRLARAVVVVVELPVPCDVQARAELDSQQPHQHGDHRRARVPQQGPRTRTVVGRGTHGRGVVTRIEREPRGDYIVRRLADRCWAGAERDRARHRARPPVERIAAWLRTPFAGES